MLALVQIPEHGDTVLSTRCSERTVGRNGNGVDVASVAVVVGLELEFRKLPHLRRGSAWGIYGDEIKRRMNVVRDLGDLDGLIREVTPLK